MTTHHYLVVGNLTEPGLLIFDLHAGGEPTAVRLTDMTNFEPFDMAAADDGGVWVLDRNNRTYWKFDRTFQVAGQPVQFMSESSAGAFRPTAEKIPPVEPDDARVAGDEPAAGAGHLSVAGIG